MEGIEDSGEDSQGIDNEEEEINLNKPISEEYYNEICLSVNQTIKTLQSEQQYNLAEEIQKVFMVCQNLRGSYLAEQEKNEQMQEQVQNAVGKVAGAFEISQIDQDTIIRLKAEIETVWKQADAAHIREQLAQEQMYEMRDRLDKLMSEMRKTEKKDGTEEMGASLAKHKDGILRERDRLNAEVEELKRRLQIQRIYSDAVEKKRMESENKNKELHKLWDQSTSEAFKEKKSVDQLKKDLEAANQGKLLLEEEINSLKTDIECAQSNQNLISVKLAQCKTNLEKVSSQLASTLAKNIKMNNELEQLAQMKSTFQIELIQSNNLLKAKEIEMSKLAKDSDQIMKSRDILQKRIASIELSNSGLVQEMLKLKNLIVTFEKERDSNKKAFDKVKKFSDLVMRERDLTAKDLQRANRTIGEHNETIILQNQSLKTQDNDIKQLMAAAQKQKGLLFKVEKERDRNAEEAQVLADKVEQVQDDLQQKINQLAQFKDDIAELTAKLVQVQQLFEVARSERNALQRDLQATSEDRDDVKDRLRIATGQTEQLKEDIDVKESELLRANKQIDKLEKDKIALKLEIINTNVILQHTRTELKEKKIENDRLYKTLSEDELKLMGLRKDLDNARNEKDLIGTQMIRKNDEIGLLNEKITIIQTALDRGDAQYNKRLDDIRLLKIEIRNLISQRNLLTRGLANTADMRQEVLQLNRLLTQARVRAKALEQEMMTPMNIHRWRKLGGRDPDKMDLIFKVQSLQKRILHQTVISTQKEVKAQEHQKMYLELKNFMVKLPNYSIKEKLQVTQKTLCAKTRKLKALKAEMTANEKDSQSKDCTIEECKMQILHLKQELLKERKAKQKMKETVDSMVAHQLYSAASSATKSLGAGFKMSATSLT